MKPGNTKAIKEMFNSISSRYDFLNDIFSFGLHRLWKKKLLNILNPNFGERWIDVCCGTGDMSILLARYMESSKNIIGIDLASEALLVARARSKETNSLIEWINADALKTNLPSNQFDGIVMAYGLGTFLVLMLGLKRFLEY